MLAPQKQLRTLFLLALILPTDPGVLFAAHENVANPISQSAMVTVTYTPDHPANRFVPSAALGAGLDGHEKGELSRMLNPRNVQEMLTAGLKPLTYRLRTELAGDAWHWNPQGSWSEKSQHQGYWVSDDRIGKPITYGYGYRLARRGSTTDQANNDGYSRIDDGDVRSFWKSNPYLDCHFTGEDDALHPQWVVIDLGEVRKVNALRLLWGTPYATQYRVEYGNQDAGPEVAFVKAGHLGIWKKFPQGEVPAGRGGEALLHLSVEPIETRFVRIWMTASSHTGSHKSGDPRDRIGYALREAFVGLLDSAGRFRDNLKHAGAHDRQSRIATSSTDPFHSATDLDNGIEQLGFDRLFKTGLTNHQPVLVPVPMLYDTPENAAALIRYLKARGYPIAGIEMGEEPEGQYIAPEDYGALYIQWADAFHQVDPSLPLGGPCLAAIDLDLTMPPDDPDTRLWMERFIKYLRAHQRLNDLGFFSFEWYPFDDVCKPTAPQLIEAPGLLASAMARMRGAGVPADIPWLITEYGYSAFAAHAEVDIEGALFNAETVAQFLTLGGSKAYLFGYEPNEVIQEIPCTWGINAMFLLGERGGIEHRLPTYYAARLVTGVWAQPANAHLEIYWATSDLFNYDRRPLVTAYAIRRPDGQWAVMVLNKDPQQAQQVGIRIANQRSGETLFFKNNSELFQYSSAEYRWKEDGDQGYPLRNLPPKRIILAATGQTITLPPFSLSIIQGEVEIGQSRR